MAKTYNTFTNVSTGSTLTATTFNNLLTNTANYRVPPACQVRRTSNLTGYTSDAAITWESAAFDTEGAGDPMWAASPNPTRITIRTAGLYVVSLIGRASGAATITLTNFNIRVNGSSSASNYLNVITATATYGTTSGIFNLAVGDYVEGAVGFAGGSAYVIHGSSTAQSQDQTRLTVTWIGQTS